MRILNRYILKESLVPLLLANAVFTGLLFLLRSLKLFDLVINKDVPAGEILLLFSYLIPKFLEISLPMSLLIALIVAFGRLSADSELVVMRATGISLRELVKPVLILASGAAVLTLILGFYIRPIANSSLGQGMYQILRTRISSGLIPGAFNQLGPLTIYAEQISRNGSELGNVLIADRRDPNLLRTFIAKHGELQSNATERLLTLRLVDGSIQEGRDDLVVPSYFDTSSLMLNPEELVGDQPTRDGKKSEEMLLVELAEGRTNLRAIERPSNEERSQLRRYDVEFHKRFALPISCLCVAIVAMVLGIQPSRGGGAWGQGANSVMGMLVIVIYYVLLAVSSALGENGTLPAAIAVWLPNLIFITLAVVMYRKMESEKWLAVSQAFGDSLARLLEILRIARPAENK